MLQKPLVYVQASDCILQRLAGLYNYSVAALHSTTISLGFQQSAKRYDIV